MPPQIVIRELAQAELDALLSLYRQLHAQDEALPERAEVERIWAAIFADPAQIYLGAFRNGELVAACNACVIPNLTRGARPYALIENVVTHVEHRRQGIGAQLIRDMLARCWQRRCYKVSLTSNMARGDAHGFYEKLGFDRHAKQAFVINASTASVA